MRTTTVVALAGAVVTIVGLGACGSGGAPGTCPAGQVGVPPNCQPVVTCNQTTVFSHSEPLDPQMLLYADFSLPDTGRLDMSLDWTHAASPMGLYLVPANTCTLAQFNTRTCNFVVRLEPSGVKPIKTSTQNVQAGNYRWLIANFSDGKESAYLQIVLSKGSGCPAFAGGSPSASSSHDAPPLVLQRAEPR